MAAHRLEQIVAGERLAEAQLLVECVNREVIEMRLPGRWRRSAVERKPPTVETLFGTCQPCRHRLVRQNRQAGRQLFGSARNAAILARGEDDTSFNLSWQLYVKPSGELTIMLEDANENNACYPVGCDGSVQPACTSTDLYVADDLWHHVVATRDAAGSLALYIDGLSVTACQNTAVPSSANQQVLTIGCTHGTIGPPPGGVEPPIWFFPGTIDEAAMWNTALSDLEVDALFTGGVAAETPPWSATGTSRDRDSSSPMARRPVTTATSA